MMYKELLKPNTAHLSYWNGVRLNLNLSPAALNLSREDTRSTPTGISGALTQGWEFFMSWETYSVSVAVGKMTASFDGESESAESTYVFF